MYKIYIHESRLDLLRWYIMPILLYSMPILLYIMPILPYSMPVLLYFCYYIMPGLLYIMPILLHILLGCTPWLSCDHFFWRGPLKFLNHFLWASGLRPLSRKSCFTRGPAPSETHISVFPQRNRVSKLDACKLCPGYRFLEFRSPSCR